MITRRSLLGFLGALPFVPKIVEAAAVSKDISAMVLHNYRTDCESACIWENGNCLKHGKSVVRYPFAPEDLA